MKPILALVAPLLAGLLPLAAAPRILPSTPSLSPESTIDLIFDHPVIPAAEIGTTTANTWLTIEPALPGTLTWQTQTIARLSPSTAPRIGASYEFSIPQNLRHLDGSEIPPGRITQLQAEPFRVVSAFTPNRWSNSFSLASASWFLIFNDAIDPAAVGPFIGFSNKGGQRVAATLEFATARDVGYHATHSPAWNERFERVKNTKNHDETTENSSPDPNRTLPNILRITPYQTLPSGDQWHIHLLEGLPNLDASARLSSPYRQQIGDIPPLRALEITALTRANQPRAIQIRFNHPLEASLPPAFFSKHLRIHPLPNRLHARIEDKLLIITGDLAGHDKYSVRIAPPLHSKDGYLLQESKTSEIEFKNLDPSIALPGTDEAQRFGGSQDYRILTFNLNSLHLRLKRLDPADLIRIHQGYRHYTGTGHDGGGIRPTFPLPAPLIRGEVVLDRTFPLNHPVNTSHTISLNWRKALPDGLTTGNWFLDLVGEPHEKATHKGRVQAQSILQLTDIGLAWKYTDTECLIHAFSCETGKPLAKVALSSYGEEARLLAEAVTDESGIARLPRSAETRHLLASLGQDHFVTAFDERSSTIRMWHFPVRVSWDDDTQPQRQVMLFTDRPLYRPGETIHLKGLVRSLHGNTVGPHHRIPLLPNASPDSPPIRLIISDPSNREILRAPITLSENGSFDFSHTLAAETVGYHSFRLEFTGDLEAIRDDNDWQINNRLERNARFRHTVRVEDFRRNSFEITSQFANTPPGASEATLEIEARHYQSGPVAGGAVSYFTRITSQNPYPERFPDFLFGNHRSPDAAYWHRYYESEEDFDHYDYENPSFGSPIQAHGTTALDANGQARIPIPVPTSASPLVRHVQVRAEVTDGNLQTLTRSAESVLYPADLHVGVSRIDRLLRAGSPVELRLVAAGTDGRPFPHDAPVTISIHREVSRTVVVQSDSGATRNHTETHEVPVTTAQVTLRPADSAGEGLPWSFTPAESGKHLVSVRGTDAEGRAFETVVSLHVYGTRDYPWLVEEGLRIRLLPETKRLKPGDTARILVLSPIEGTALVTLEREKIIRSFLTPLRADQPVIEIPILEDDAPNAYVSVMVIRGAQDSARQHKEPGVRLGYCELLVDPAPHRLHLSLTPDASDASYLPGSDVSLSGTVTRADGSPAASAEITLYAVDEGTLAVTGAKTPNPLAFFHNPRVLSVKAGTSLDHFLPENPNLHYHHNKGFFIGGGDGEAPQDLLTRRNFTPCATWAPTLKADSSGRFQHQFRLPDTLTRYRLVAIAHEADARFGSAETTITARKELMLEPKAPRFLHQSDQAVTRLMVQNTSQLDGEWEIHATSPATGESQGSSPCRFHSTGPILVRLAAGETTHLDFPLDAIGTGQATLRWSATPVLLRGAPPANPTTLTRFSDQVELSLPVHHPMPLLRQRSSASLRPDDKPLALRSFFESTLADGTGEVTLEFARSPLVEAGESVDFLLRYPYGCLEQTTSALMPWLAVNALQPYLPALAETTPQQVAAAIQAGVDRILAMQRENGAFSYWPDSSTQVDWASSYAALAIVLAKQHDAHIPEAAWNNLKQFLIGSLRGAAEERSPARLEWHSRTLLVLALAGDPQPAYHNRLSQIPEALNASARAHLAAAIALTTKDSPSQIALARSLLLHESPTPAPDPAVWLPPGAVQAHQLFAWTCIDPQGPETNQLLDQLLRPIAPHHFHTWHNGWSMLALRQYALATPAPAHSLTVQLTQPGQNTPQSFTLDPAKPTTRITLPLHQALEASLSCQGGPAFLRILARVKPAITPLQPVATNGMAIDRIHEKILPDGSSELLTQAQPGDLIRVTLRVTLPTDPSHYLVIDDPLPSIFETVQTTFASQRTGQELKTSENDWSISRTELRDDRAVFFLDYVPHGRTYQIQYLARCTLAGQVVAPPAKIEAMYNPTTFALSASRSFEAAPAP